MHRFCYRTFTKLLKRKVNRWIKCRNYSPTVCLPVMPPCDFMPCAYSGRCYDDLVNSRYNHVPGAYCLMYKTPLLLYCGHRQWLWDATGCRYLDMLGGMSAVSVGHCHPIVNDAVSKQQNIVGHTTNMYYNSMFHDFVEYLASKFIGELKYVFLVNSGTEAVDLALLLARLYTDNFDVISMRNGFHGLNSTVMGLNSIGYYRHKIPCGAGVHHTVNPDPLGGVWGGCRCRDSPSQPARGCGCTKSECAAAYHYYNQLEQLIQFSIPSKRLAAMIFEPIQCVGGITQFTRGYMLKASQLIRHHGGLIISDESQTGLGRMGEEYWGYQSHTVTPDVVVLSKGLGNGFPLAAVVTSCKIAEALSGAKYFNTFGGNPLACAAGFATLRVIDEEQLQYNAQEVGTYLIRLLAQLMCKYKEILDVRGKGLMVGVELVDAETCKPMKPEHVSSLLELMREMGVLTAPCGINRNVLRLTPPLCVTQCDAEFTAAVLDVALHYYKNPDQFRQCHPNVCCR